MTGKRKITGLSTRQLAFKISLELILENKACFEGQDWKAVIQFLVVP